MKYEEVSSNRSEKCSEMQNILRRQERERSNTAEPKPNGDNQKQLRDKDLKKVLLVRAGMSAPGEGKERGREQSCSSSPGSELTALSPRGRRGLGCKQEAQGSSAGC